MSKDLAFKKLAELPFAGTIPSPQVENDKMVTGGWRIMRPIVDFETCTHCWNCWIWCADACYTRADEGPVVNLKYCKGCGVCANECPVGAITMAPELDFQD